MKPTPLKFLSSLIDIDISSNPLILGASIDSRLVKKGDLFFALTGQRSDGHDFLKDVSEKGALAACVKEEYQGPNFGLVLLKVPDVLTALQEMAKKVLEKRKCQVVAITGSMGKTTTKEFTATLLETTYRLTKSPLSYNSKSTLPLSILMGSEEDEVLVLEMGMSEKGEIAKLISIAPPDIACLTTITYQHSTGFPEGLLGIAREKGSIFSHPKTKVAIVNKNAPHFDVIEKIGNAKKMTFSIEGEADFSGEVAPNGILINKEIFIPCDLPMKAHYQNFLAAVTIARTMNVSWESIKKAALRLALPPMRFQKMERDGIVFINDAYNANPEAVKAALEALPKPSKEGKTIAVLSEMNALGNFTEEGHTSVAQAALSKADLLLCLGKNALTMKKIWDAAGKPVYHFESKESLKVALKSHVKKGDIVLLKGARAWALEELLKDY
jgi:UDP-N-acetylmuramoyl-tripeptide--D-alanyl-D-alanine ligase